METIIVTTDFSASSANALNYACALAQANRYKLILTHVYTIPVTYTGESLSLASVNDALNADQERLNVELDRVRWGFPGLTIQANMLVGNYLETLQGLVDEIRPVTIIMGAAGKYSELWLWDDDWLNALIDLSCPVLIVPADITYQPYRNIAFACDYKKVCLPHQANVIKRLVKLSGATLHIVHVTTETSDVAASENAAQLSATFRELNPQYHMLEDRRIIKAISDFTVEYNIDLLLVMPHKHGLWYSLLHKSYTRQLAQLNHLPVLAIHE